MSQIAGKTVYVLGAGASYHTGAPLLKDFLVTGRLLLDSGVQLRFKESFERIFELIDSLRASSYYVEFDLDNLEHVFSLIEMGKQLNWEGSEQRFSDLRFVILETLDKMCKLRWLNSGDFLPDEDYGNFSGLILSLNQARMSHLRQGKETFDPDSIITFNYDVMFDFALLTKSAVPDYCLSSDAERSKFFIEVDGFEKRKLKVHKLHGSTNWGICAEIQRKETKNELHRNIQTIPLNFSGTVRPQFTHGQKYEFNIVTEIMQKITCPYCQTKSSLEPFIIPPTWSKRIENPQLAMVWASAVEEIKKAFQIIVIGYSMPQTDTFFQYLLTLGLVSNSELNRIVVVNVDRKDNFKERYKRIFSRSLNDRGRLKFVCGVSFSDFVKKGAYMQTIGGQVEWQLPEDPS